MKTKFIQFAVAGTAVVELALSQFTIKITRLSAVEITGIALFSFIILSMVTLFAVTRIGDKPGSRIFSIVMNLCTALAATWYLSLLFQDSIFFRNLYYALDRHTQTYELIPVSGRIAVSVPLAFVILGTAVYYLSALGLLIAGLGRNRKAGKGSANE